MGTFSFLGTSFFVLASIVLLIWFFCLRQLLKGRLCFHALICWEVCSIASLTEWTLMKKFVSIGNLQSYGTAVMLSAIRMGRTNTISSLFKNILKKIGPSHFLFLFFKKKVLFYSSEPFLTFTNAFACLSLHVMQNFHQKVLRCRLTSREINLHRLDGYAFEIFLGLN